MFYSFENDYSEGCSSEILEALIKINNKQSSGYGLDECCKKAIDLLKEKIAVPGADIHFVPGGTPCNIIAIASALRPYEAVIACQSGHINVHETGAIEATGHKILTAKGKDGKILPEEIEEICLSHGDEHMVKPAMVFVSQSTELSTVYSLEELKAIRVTCDKYGLLLYLDGARLNNALALKDNDLGLKDIAQLCDMFYIGGTKNGALLGEAMVIIKDELKTNFRYNLKQRGFMLAKSRIIGLSFYELFKDGLYLKNAQHANKCADALRLIFKTFDIPEYLETRGNQVFPVIENTVLSKLKEKYKVLEWGAYDENKTIIRMTTSWATKEDAILEFAADLKKII